MVGHAGNPSMRQAESGRSCTPGQPELQRGLHMYKHITNSGKRHDCTFQIVANLKLEPTPEIFLYFQSKGKSEERND